MLRRSLAVVAAVAALTVAGCSSGGSTTDAGPTVPAAPAGGPLDLRGTCPDTVVLQQDWQPEAEHGAMYSLVGGDRQVDASAKKVSGRLVAQGVDTGVRVEVRPGGSSVGFQPVSALMAVDPSITLGAVTSDDALAASAKQPVVTVTSQITTSPQILMWDPASHPGATTIRQAAASGAPVVTSGDVIPGLLKAQGIMTPAQQDLSYDGTPARFVSDPRILQQGFATAEPYLYQNEIRQWARPIAFQKLADVGYSVYPEALAVSRARLDALRPCLRKLVPIMQRAQLDYLANPGPTNQLIVDLVDQYQTGWSYSAGVADYAAKELPAFLSNDPSSGVFGRMDPARWAQIVATFGPILQGTGALPAGPLPDPTTLYTNEFIDAGVRMP